MDLNGARNSARIADDIELFNDWTRDITVIFLLLSPLSLFAYFLICKYRRKQDLELEQPQQVVQVVDDDAFASKFVILASTVALTVSEGAILLLPFSVLANEVLHSYPSSYYFQWMSSSLIHGLWNLISLISNVALITLILAYFISESEGFENSRKGIFSRVKEALITVAFVFIFLFGFVLLLWHFLNDETWSVLSFSSLTNLHLPWFYTCLSFTGAVILLFATPYGYAQMFSIVGSLVKRPLLSLETSVEYLNSDYRTEIETPLTNGGKDYQADDITPSELEEELEEYLNPSFFRRTLLYPLLMVLMMIWTSFCILVCFINLVSMTLGLRDLPGVSRLADVGITSLSSLGMIGAALEILIIGYTVVAFLVGFYNFPWMSRLMPKAHDTSLTKIVANCAVILLLSSALPLFVRVIGITNFDLLGNFVHISWLRNLRVIVGYNMAYLIFSVLALTAHATNAVWQSICQRLKIGTSGIKKVAQRSTSQSSALKERLTDLVASKLLYVFTKNGYLKKHN
ncbi:Limb region 1 protein-like protein [Hypsibius exemplaris]|uniref:Limb region 1 protein-like protein n=1 Tax=Hypsibius exemplaris TaxID=2072580 RepID=A0A1W0XC10_HYPEX|nr:Limb region 1 protein-like protein [Hypsibius exemplaris]